MTMKVSRCACVTAESYHMHMISSIWYHTLVTIIMSHVTIYDIRYYIVTHDITAYQGSSGIWTWSLRLPSDSRAGSHSLAGCKASATRTEPGWGSAPGQENPIPVTTDATDSRLGESESAVLRLTVLVVTMKIWFIHEKWWIMLKIEHL